MPVSSFTHLTPLAFLERAADVFADKTAIAYGDHRMSYSEFGAEATRLAHALRASGIERGDRVAYMCPNIPEMLVANFGVPLAGAVLVPVNTRLSADEVRYICDHSGAKLLVVDTEYLPALAPVLETLQSVVEIVAVTDPLGPAPEGAAEHASITYDELMMRGSGEALPWSVEDETSLISINYTSGTTGTPKGVMYAHRGAYLNSARRDPVRRRVLPPDGRRDWPEGAEAAAARRRHPARRGRLAGAGRLGTGHHGDGRWPGTRRSSATGSRSTSTPTCGRCGSSPGVAAPHQRPGARRCGSRTMSTWSSSARTPREGPQPGFLGLLAVGGLGLEELLTHVGLRACGGPPAASWTRRPRTAGRGAPRAPPRGRSRARPGPRGRRPARAGRRRCPSPGRRPRRARGRRGGPAARAGAGPPSCDDTGHQAERVEIA